MPTILVEDKSGSVQRLEIDKPEVAIGRLRAQNDVVLNEGIISKRHARLCQREGRWVVEDLQSTCGTWVNGLRISEPYLLKPGDKIYIGEFILQIEIPTAAIDLPGFDEDDED
jgi:pilus assembly protein CpaF